MWVSLKAALSIWYRFDTLTSLVYIISISSIVLSTIHTTGECELVGTTFTMKKKRKKYAGNREHEYFTVYTFSKHFLCILNEYFYLFFNDLSLFITANMYFECTRHSYGEHFDRSYINHYSTFTFTSCELRGIKIQRNIKFMGEKIFFFLV